MKRINIKMRPSTEGIKAVTNFFPQFLLSGESVSFNPVIVLRPSVIIISLQSSLYFTLISAILSILPISYCSSPVCISSPLHASSPSACHSPSHILFQCHHYFHHHSYLPLYHHHLHCHITTTLSCSSPIIISS